uniref:Uncharacterized protein n=1 Tax=Opuntia streptacantha TaxID=393608 RepID=A0A7C9DP30_OPUST
MIEIRMFGIKKKKSGYQLLLSSDSTELPFVCSGVQQRISLPLVVELRQFVYATMSKKITGGSVNLYGKSMTLRLRAWPGIPTIFFWQPLQQMENAEYFPLLSRVSIKRVLRLVLHLAANLGSKLFSLISHIRGHLV